jgi:NAD(P)-dependent dehydrogenase (short-subunit alcohol dehydrogenase family)
MSAQGVAVVTGGASGIGEACSRELAKQGFTVAVLDRNIDLANAVATEIGGRARAVDVGDDASVESAAAWVEAEMGPVTALVNSAGILQVPVRPFELSMEVFDDVVRVNQRGTYLACVVFGRAMVARRRGSIVNIASIAGLIGYSGNPAYLASKGGVVQVTRALAVEWATRGVRVNAIAPGVIGSPLVEKQVEREPEFYVAFRERHPVNRFGTPDELVGPALFLCADASSFVTGHVLAVDGGYTAA